MPERLARALVLGLAVAAGPAAADWRDDVGSITLGAVATHGPVYARARLEPFRAFLEARFQLSVELVMFPGYAELVRAQAGEQIDIATHTSFSYAATANRCGCVEPVAAPLAAGDVTGFHAIVVAAAGSGIDGLEDAAGARFAVTAPDSIAGYAAPVTALEASGVSPAEVTIQPAADPVDAVTMVLIGEADLAVAWSSLAGNEATGHSFGVLTDMVREGLMEMDEIVVVWQSPLIPFGPVAVRSSAPAELKVLLLDALLSLDNEAPGILDAVVTLPYAAGGFARVAPSDYDYMSGLVGN